jgi:hypothetical protein
MTGTSPDDTTRRPETVAVVSWVATLVATLVLAWVFAAQWQTSVALAPMYEGLGLTAPPLARLLLERGGPLFMGLASICAALLIVKELVVKDARVRLGITLLTATIALVLAQCLTHVYLQPLLFHVEQLR